MTKLTKFLTEQGIIPTTVPLAASQPFPSHSSIHLSISANGPILYLPFNPAKKNRSTSSERDPNSFGMEGEDEEGDQDQSDEEDHQSSNQSQSDTKRKGLHHNVTSHTFAIIVKLDRTLDLVPTIKVNYHTDSAVAWTGSERSKRSPFNDRFRVSEHLNWDLDMGAPNAFIPLKSSKSDNIEDTVLRLGDDENDNDSGRSSVVDYRDNETSHTDVDIQYGDEEYQHEIKTYVPLEPMDYVREPGGIKSLDDDTQIETNLFQNYDESTKKLDAGTYVFLLPVVFPMQTPETVHIPNGYIIHKLDIQILLPPKRDLKIPQSAALSTSPGHLMNAWGEISGNITEELSFQAASTASKSIFKRIGIRRNSSSSQRSMAASSPPARVRSPSGSNAMLSPLNGSRRGSIVTMEDRIVNFRYLLPVVRLPPSDATSTLNKSIYVNKVWNKSLGYEIVLPKKYTMLTAPDKILRKQELLEKKRGGALRGAHMKKHTVGLQVKLVPLTKGLILKRIKVNIVEKVTYTSLQAPTSINFQKVSVNSADTAISNSTSSTANCTSTTANHNGSTGSVTSSAQKHSNSRVKERTVPLYEIHTKPSSKKSGLPPLYEQSIKNCKNENLLTFCYNNDSHAKDMPSATHFGTKMARFLDSSIGTTTKDSCEKNDDIVVTNPIKLEVPITFFANDERFYVENVWHWLNKSQNINESDKLQFGMAAIDDLSRRNSITTMRSRVGSITSITSLGSGGANIDTLSTRDVGELSVVGSPNTVIPSIVTTNETGISTSVLSNQQTNPSSHPDGTSFLGNMFGHNNLNHHHHGTQQQQQSAASLEKSPSMKDMYSFFPDITSPKIKVRHRLQLAFRISKPDDNLKMVDGVPKMHHYEVIVDTPIAFTSALSDGDNELPSYESVAGGFTPLSFVDSAQSLSSGEVIFQPSSPLMSNGGFNLKDHYTKGPPGYSSGFSSYSSFDLGGNSTSSSNGQPRRNVATSLLSAALKRDHNSLNSLLAGSSDRVDANEPTLDQLLLRQPTRSSLDFQERMEDENPPAYDEVVLSDGLERVGLLNDTSEDEGEDNSMLNEDEADDDMSLCTGL